MASIRLLSPDDDRSSFRSGNEDLDRFFRKYAALNQYVHHLGVTYVATEGQRLLGYATIAPASIQGDDFAMMQAKKLPQYPLPALRLARLAVAKEMQGKGIGTGLLRFVFSLALEMSARLGCVGILVDAKPSAVPYYKGFGFEPRMAVSGQSGDRPEPVVMFLSLDKVRNSIGSGP
jgi:predicted N-acetyltransferase YhbS